MPLNACHLIVRPARRQFFARLEALYEREGAGVEFDAFRFELVRRCKEYLKKN
jgi:hypothetical protein